VKLTDGLGLTLMLASRGLRALTGTSSEQQEPDKNCGDACLL